MIQSLINQLYRYPVSRWKTIQRFGGIISYRQMLRGKKEMIKASRNLPPIISYEDGYKIYFLTGSDYLYQTLFCAFSLMKVSKTQFQFVLIDDGSFDEKLKSQASKQMPGVRIITKEEIDRNLLSKLPLSDFPYLHHKRKVYPHIKKLTDIHTLTDETYKLVLDSDMLFWSNPKEVISWLKKPNGSLHMIDCIESYGYSKETMKSLTGSDIPNSVNVGIIGMDSSRVIWTELERWCMELETKEGSSYFLEQALTTMLLATSNRKALNERSYIVNPPNEVVLNGTGILHHYVDLSKASYFKNAFNVILNGIR